MYLHIIIIFETLHTRMFFKTSSFCTKKKNIYIYIYAHILRAYVPGTYIISLLFSKMRSISAKSDIVLYCLCVIDGHTVVVVVVALSHINRGRIYAYIIYYAIIIWYYILLVSFFYFFVTPPRVNDLKIFIREIVLRSKYWRPQYLHTHLTTNINRHFKKKKKMIMY